MKRFILVFMVLLLAVFTYCKKAEVKSPADDMIVRVGTEVTEKTRQTPEGWTDKPSLDVIPDEPVKGMANSVPFEANAVYFEPVFGKWSMIISDGVLDSPTGFIMQAQSINVSLPELPEKGKIIEKDMEYGDGYFHIRKKDDPEEFTSWNSNNAFIIEFTEWELNEWDPEKDMFQVAGKASGRIYISYQGWDSGDFDDSYAAGTFTDAVIRYMGEPELEY